MFKNLILLILLLLIFSGCGAQTGDSTLVDGVDSNQHRIFVTSTDHDGNLGGVSGADTICQNLAQSAGLVKTYKALLSSSSVSAKTRLALTGSVVKVSSTGAVTIALTAESFWNASSSNQHLNAIDLDENKSQRPGQFVWTGTSATGVGTLAYCSTGGNDWTSNSSDQDGDYGSTDFKTDAWTELNFENCDFLNPLYCISVN